MSALSRLLIRVSKRVLTNNPTNDELLQTADRVVLWCNADYITDEQVAELEVLIDEYYNPPEPNGGADEPEPEESSTIAETTLENASQDFSSMTKAELLEYCSAHGIEAYESWTKAEIIAAIEGE